MRHISRAVLPVLAMCCLASLAYRSVILMLASPSNLGEFVQVPAVHHVPRRESVAQVVEPEILDSRRLQGTFEAAVHSLPSTLRPRLGRKDPLFSKHLWEAPKLLSQLR